MDNSRPIIQMDLDSNFIKEFPSIRSAMKALGGLEKYIHGIRTACTITRRYKLVIDVNRINKPQKLKPKSNIYMGYRWRYKETT